MARDVLVLATRGCWTAVMASIIATVLTTELAGERFVNHRESEVLVIIEVVQDQGVGFGEGLRLRGLMSSED